MVGDEPYEPYDRPALSKRVLAGRMPVRDVVLPLLRDVGAEWLLGTAATGLDLTARQIAMAEGRRIGFDRS